MKILVTGADGFVGRRLCGELRKRGHSVRGALWQPAALPDGCESFVVGDIGHDADWSAALNGVDVVIHLAARVHIMDDSAVEPLTEYRKVNTAGTLRLASEAARTGVKRFVYISTIKVNGEGNGGEKHKAESGKLKLEEIRGQKTEDGGPRKAEDGHAVNFGQRTEGRAYTEEDVPAPEDAYAISKWEAELGLRKIEAEKGLEVVIVRPTLVYGPGVKANFLQLLRTVHKGLPLPFGCIDNRRSLIGLGNMVDAIITCATHPKAAGNTFLVSDGDDVSTPELIRRIARAIDRPARLLPLPVSFLRLAGKLTGKGDAVNRLLGSLTVDSSKIKLELGWKPPFTMEEELAKTTEWFLGKSRKLTAEN